MRESFRRRGLSNAKIYELDLMTGDLPKGNYDFSWCRWVLSFVSDQTLLIKKLGDVMPKAGISIFHEYAHYGTWRFLPPIPSQEKFRGHVIATWRESGGEPDGAADLPVLLSQNGFIIRSATPHIFCVRPTNYMWQWPVTFIEVYLPRLVEMGRIDQAFADKVRADLAGAGENRNALMITPLVVEIVAEKFDRRQRVGLNKRRLLPLLSSRAERGTSHVRKQSPRKEASHRWRDPSPSCATQDDTAMRHRAGQACWNEIANSFSQIEL